MAEGSIFDSLLPDSLLDTIRDTIRGTMDLGKPQNPDEQVTFKWDVQRTFSRADRAGVPYDLGATAATETQHPDVKVPVAVEFAVAARTDDAEGLGTFDPSKAVITLLDDDYEKVKTADYVMVGGDTYDIVSAIPLGALKSMTVWQVHVVARSKA